MSGLGLEYKNSLPATRNIRVVRPGRTVDERQDMFGREDDRQRPSSGAPTDATWRTLSSEQIQHEGAFCRISEECAVVDEPARFNADLADKSTWLWLTSEQLGFPLRPTRGGGGEHEGRVKNLDSSQRLRTT